MDGPVAPERSLRFDPTRYLIDPYAKAIVGDIPAGHGKCVVVDEQRDWVPDIHLRTPMRDTIIYEAHVRGLTAHPSADASRPGTYRALMLKGTDVSTFGEDLLDPRFRISRCVSPEVRYH